MVDGTGIMKKLKTLIHKCRESNSFLPYVLAKYFLYHLKGRKILANDKVIISGIGNIRTEGLLQIGMEYVGFMHKYDRTYLNVNGQLNFCGRYSIGKGCRFDIGRNAIAEFGQGYVGANTHFIIMHGLKVGNGCAISWGCQFLDEDFHEIEYEGRIKTRNEIVLGDNVWIGCNVSILKGCVIPDGCVVAANSVVRGQFSQENCLIAGNPATIVREAISWR